MARIIGWNETTSPISAADLMQLRRAAGLTMEELACLLDCERGTISSQESFSKHGPTCDRPWLRFLTLVCYPPIRDLMPAAVAWREQVLGAQAGGDEADVA